MPIRPLKWPALWTALLDLVRCQMVASGFDLSTPDLPPPSGPFRAIPVWLLERTGGGTWTRPKTAICAASC